VKAFSYVASSHVKNIFWNNLFNETQLFKIAYQCESQFQNLDVIMKGKHPYQIPTFGGYISNGLKNPKLN
jgi:hypothetical protein